MPVLGVAFPDHAQVRHLSLNRAFGPTTLGISATGRRRIAQGCPAAVDEVQQALTETRP
jgi:hypothetical protein